MAKVEYDDPQIWTVEELLQSERDGIAELVEQGHADVNHAMADTLML